MKKALTLMILAACRFALPAFADSMEHFAVSGTQYYTSNGGSTYSTSNVSGTFTLNGPFAPNNSPFFPNGANSTFTGFNIQVGSFDFNRHNSSATIFALNPANPVIDVIRFATRGTGMTLDLIVLGLSGYGCPIAGQICGVSAQLASVGGGSLGSGGEWSGLNGLGFDNSWLYSGSNLVHLGNNSISGTVILTVVPEPGTLGLMGIGLLGLAGAVRRRQSGNGQKTNLRDSCNDPPLQPREHAVALVNCSQA